MDTSLSHEEMDQNEAEALPSQEKAPIRRSGRTPIAAAAARIAAVVPSRANNDEDNEAEDDAEDDAEDEEENAEAEDEEHEISELMNTLVDRVECRWTVVDEGACGLFPQEGLCLVGLKIIVPPEYKGNRKHSGGQVVKMLGFVALKYAGGGLA